MISLQLRQQRLRRRPQLIAGAAQGHGEARVEHVAQLDKDDALRRLNAASAIAARRGGGDKSFGTGHSSPKATILLLLPMLPTNNHGAMNE